MTKVSSSMNQIDLPQNAQRNQLLELMESSKKTADTIFRYTSVAIMIMMIVLASIFFALVIIDSPVMIPYGEFLLTWAMFALVGVSSVGINFIAIEMVTDKLNQDNGSADDILGFVIHRTIGWTLLSIIGIIIIPLLAGNAELEIIMPGVSAILIAFLFVAIGTTIGGLSATAHLILRKRTL